MNMLFVGVHKFEYALLCVLAVHALSSAKTGFVAIPTRLFLRTARNLVCHMSKRTHKRTTWETTHNYALVPVLISQCLPSSRPLDVPTQKELN